MMRSTSKRSLGFLLLAYVSVQFLGGGCGGDPAANLPEDPAGAGLPSVLQVRALSNRYVEVSFSGAVESTWEDPGRFLITGPEKSVLPVEDVRVAGADRSKLLLHTGPQRPVEYRIRIIDGPRTTDLLAFTGQIVTFMGSTDPKPSVHTAVALDNTHVLVLFGDAESPVNFDTPAHYQIAGLVVMNVDPPSSTPIAGLPPVPGFGVVLTTAAQAGNAYTVDVFDVDLTDGEDILVPNSATFLGVAVPDRTSPTIRSAAAASSTSVLVAFTEPLDEVAISCQMVAGICTTTPTPQIQNRFQIAGSGVNLLLNGASLQFMNTHVLLDTGALTFGVEYRLEVVQPIQVKDAARNQYQDPRDPAALTFIGAAASPVSVGDLEPRVVGALSTSNTTVVVAFNKAMNDSAAQPSSYVVVTGNVNAEAGGLVVEAARFLTTDGTDNGPLDRSRVELTTMSQSTVEYHLSVIGVHDMDGYSLAPRRLGSDGGALIFLGGNETAFAGTGPSGALIDSDGDGLSDAAEQLGWNVIVYLSDGTMTAREVTSEPTLPDTDLDGLSDSTEKMLATDPRDNDTDDDTVLDQEEFRTFLSSPINQDTDGDGLSDPKELRLFKTSPILADTDGDGFDDAEEVIGLNRDPRVADLPRPAIKIGNMRLQIDERYTYTDEQGDVVTLNSSSATSMSQSNERTFSTSETSLSGSAREAFLKGGIEATISAKPGLTIKGEAGVTWKSHDEHTSQFSQASSIAAQQTFDQSVAKGRSFSTTSSVTRSIVDASIDVDLTVENAGDIAFSISNLELTALYPTGLSLDDYLPVATLLPSSALTGGAAPTYNLGPFTDQLGPFIFSNREVFPNLVDELLRSPRGLVFEIANYDITDEFGRNFAFATQETRDRTAGITIDYGDGTVDRFLIATSGGFDDQNYVGGDFVGGFDDQGRSRGIPLDFALQDILHLTKNSQTADAIIAGSNGIADSVAQGDDIQVVAFGTSGLRDTDVVITAGADDALNSPLLGDDLDAVATGYETSPTCNTDTVNKIVNGDNPTADTEARGDDIQVVPVGDPASPDISRA